MMHGDGLAAGLQGPAYGNIIGKTSTANASLVTAPPTGQYFWMTDVIMINHDPDTAITVSLKSGSSTVFAMTLDAAQGLAHGFSKPVRFPSAATVVNAGLSATADSPGVDIFVNGFYGPAN